MCIHNNNIQCNVLLPEVGDTVCKTLSIRYTCLLEHGADYIISSYIIISHVPEKSRKKWKNSRGRHFSAPLYNV